MQPDHSCRIHLAVHDPRSTRVDRGFLLASKLGVVVGIQGHTTAGCSLTSSGRGHGLVYGMGMWGVVRCYVTSATGTRDWVWMFHVGTVQRQRSLLRGRTAAVVRNRSRSDDPFIFVVDIVVCYGRQRLFSTSTTRDTIVLLIAICTAWRIAIWRCTTRVVGDSSRFGRHTQCRRHNTIVAIAFASGVQPGTRVRNCVVMGHPVDFNLIAQRSGVALRSLNDVQRNGGRVDTTRWATQWSFLPIVKYAAPSRSGFAHFSRTRKLQIHNDLQKQIQTLIQ